MKKQARQGIFCSRCRQSARSRGSKAVMFVGSGTVQKGGQGAKGGATRRFFGSFGG